MELHVLQITPPSCATGYTGIKTNKNKPKKTKNMKKFFSKTENQSALFCVFLALTMAVPVIAYFKNTLELLTGCIFVLSFLGAAIAMFNFGND